LTIIAPSNYRAPDSTADSSAPSALAWAMAAACAVYGALLIGGEKLLNDADTLWHIAAGRWIWLHRAVPTIDPFSHSFQGQPWVAHEWLAECLTAALYDRLGWTGVVIGAAFAGAAAFAVLSYALSRFLAPKFALPAAALSFVLAAPHMTARPHLFAMPLLVLWVAGLVSARAARRTPSPWLLPVMVLWANLHGGFVVGLALCAGLAAEAVLAAPGQARRPTLRKWGLFVAGAGLASLVTPQGIAGWLFPLRLMSLGFSLDFVDEWHAPDFAHFQSIELWFAGFAALLISYRPRPSPIRVLLLFALGYMAATHARNAELLAFIGPLLIAEPLGKVMRDRPSSLDPRAGLALSVFALCAIAAATSWAAMRGFTREDSHIMPAQALAAARDSGLNGPVFNDYDFGGYLIFSGVPVFVDGRVDLYGDAFMRAYAGAEANEGDALPRLLQRYHIAWTLLPPAAAAVKALDRMPEWRRVYADDKAVVHRRIRETRFAASD
jgi:hypothetical protein